MLLYDILEHIPHSRICTLYHALRVLDILCDLRADELMHHERLEQLESHLLRNTALMKLQLWSDCYNRAARVVDALSKQVLTETPLLTFQHIRKGLQWTIARPRNRASATTIIYECIYCFLQHALLVPDNDIRCTEVEQAL